MTDQRPIQFGGVNLNKLGVGKWPAPAGGRTVDLDEECLHVDAPGTMTTWTGLRVDPQAMRPFDLAIEDIAHALARQCRYNGHTFGHLSVARHCLWVSDYLCGRGRSPELALWGLLHDAGEAYLGDMVRPLKHSPQMKVFRDAEDRLDEVIARRFNLEWPRPSKVGEADSWVCANQEMPEGGARWAWVGSAAFDEYDYLSRYRALTGETS